jgi:thioredoxin-like negative regulator of GroEL
VDSLVRSRVARVGVSGIFVIIFGLYVYSVLRTWRADWLQDRSDPESLQASAQFQPWDARTHHLLGRYFLYGAQDASKALASLQRAVELNAYDGTFWIDLATAYELAGDSERSEQALQQALRAEPTSTDVAWNVANYYLAHNDSSRALPLLRVVLQHDETRNAAALDLCWRTTNNVTAIAAQALPDQARFYFALLKILLTQSESAPANELWRALIAKSLGFPIEEAFPYFDYLIQTAQIDQAKQVWKDLHKLNSGLPDDSPSDLVRNGSFEADFLNGGFDWRTNETNQVDVSLDTSEFHSGRRSLRISFSGPGVADIGAYEYVPVEANTRYQLRAFVKTQDIVTASGPRLAAQDVASGDTLASTKEFLDTSGWLQRTVDLTTGPNTHLLAVRIIREPGNPLVKGSFWIDDVELKPISIDTQGVVR